MPSEEHVLNRIQSLRQLNADAEPEKWRIRSIMNGGADGMRSVMAWDQGKGSSGHLNSSFGTDLPTVNLMASGLDRLAQHVGRAPTLKPVPSQNDTARRKHLKRVGVVDYWDKTQRMDLTFPQLGRWLPGYAFAAYIIKHGRDPNGNPYPIAELRDPYDVWVPWVGPHQQPQELATRRIVPLYSLQTAFPELAWESFEARMRSGRVSSGNVGRSEGGGGGTRSWEGKRSGVEVIEYYCIDGTYVCVPEVEMVLAHIPNPINRVPFAYGHRYSFDRPISQYHHVIGLMSMMSKLNVLGLIASEDSVFRETNIIGEMEGGEYERGRFAINMFREGSRIEKPTGDIGNQIWAQIDRLERQLRIGSAYDVQQDAISPNSFATGQGMRELQGAVQNNVREYQMVIAAMMTDIDSMRLEWIDQVYPTKRMKYYDMGGEESFYKPSKDIKGDYRTERVYGAMATWDDQAQLVVGLQLLQADALDTETFQENIDGLRNIPLINERITQKKAKDTLFARLAARSEQDPKADAALVEIVESPDKATEILKKYFTPQEPQMDPAQAAMMQQMAAGGMPGAPPGAGPGPGAPPDMGPEPISTVLSRVGTEGVADAGVQTVSRLGG